MSAQQLQNADAATVLERSMCIMLTIRAIGNNRKIDVREFVKAATTNDETPHDGALAVDEAQFRAIKRLLDPKVLRPCLRIQNRAKATLRALAIPTHRVFGERSYLIGLGAVDEADAKLTALAAELFVEAGKLADAYDAQVEAQRERLGPLFRGADYLTAAQIRTAFTIEWDYVQFAAPDKLETVSSAVYNRAVARSNQQWAAAFEEGRLVLRETLRQIVGDLVATLEPQPDGSRKKAIRGTVLKDLAEFLRTYAGRDITADTDMEALVATLRGATRDLDADKLRESETFKADLLVAAKQATAQLDELVVETRGRAIAFGLLDDAA